MYIYVHVQYGFTYLLTKVFFNNNQNYKFSLCLPYGVIIYMYNYEDNNSYICSFDR